MFNLMKINKVRVSAPDISNVVVISLILLVCLIVILELYYKKVQVEQIIFNFIVACFLCSA